MYKGKVKKDDNKWFRFIESESYLNTRSFYLIF